VWRPDHHADHHYFNYDIRTIQTPCAASFVNHVHALSFWEEVRWHHQASRLRNSAPNACGPIDISDRAALDWCGWLHTCYNNSLASLVGPGITSACMAFNQEIPEPNNGQQEVRRRLELVLTRLDGCRVKLHPEANPILEMPDMAAAFPLGETGCPQDICWTTQQFCSLPLAYAEDFGCATSETRPEYARAAL